MQDMEQIFEIPSEDIVDEKVIYNDEKIIFI